MANFSDYFSYQEGNPSAVDASSLSGWFANPNAQLNYNGNLLNLVSNGNSYAGYYDNNGQRTSVPITRNTDGTMSFGPPQTYNPDPGFDTADFVKNGAIAVGGIYGLGTALAGAAGSAAAGGSITGMGGGGGGGGTLADVVGSDWAAGQATGATGGLLPQTSAGLTAANGATVNELGIPIEDIGDWTMDDWGAWSRGGSAADPMGVPDLRGSPLIATGMGSSGLGYDATQAIANGAGNYSLRDLWNDFNTGARTLGTTANSVLGGGANGGLGGLAAAYIQAQQQQRMADQFMSLTQPYRDQATKYGSMLQQSYDDPSAYLNGGEYQALAKTNLDLLQRQDAAGGRLANDFGRQAKMQDFAMSHLDDYRKGLQGLYQNMASIGTGQGTQMGIALGGTSNSPYARWLGGATGS